MFSKTNTIEHFPTSGGIHKHGHHHPHRPSVNRRVVDIARPYKRHLMIFSGGFGLLSLLILIIVIVVLIQAVKK